MYAIINENSVFIGYTADQNFDLLATYPNEVTSLVMIDEIFLNDTILPEFMQGKEYKLDNDVWIENDLLTYLKERKVLDANTYFHTIDYFLANSNECRISKQALRDFYIDLNIRKDDESVNGSNACVESLDIENLTMGTITNIDIPTAESIVFKVRCYKQKIENVLKNHIEAITQLTTGNDVQNYNVQGLYPVIPEITY